MRVVLVLFLAGFVGFCGWLVVESGLLESSTPITKPFILLQKTSENESVAGASSVPEEASKLQAVDLPEYSAAGGPEKDISLGSVDPRSGYKFQLELSSKGAAISKAIFSEFYDRDPDYPQPLEVFSPIQLGGDNEILSMALSNFGLFLDPKSDLLRPFALDQISWESIDTKDSSQSARFEVSIKDEKGQTVIKLTRTYKIAQDSYLLESEITVENLSGLEQKVQFNLNGAGGFGRESFRTDMRNVVAGYKGTDGKVESERLDMKKLFKAKEAEDRELEVDNLLWAATVNKYFAAILVPQYDDGDEWIAGITGRHYNPDGDEKAKSGDETIGIELRIAANTLGAKEKSGSIRTYKFKVYIGPKDKSLFDKNEMYSDLGFVETIDFLGCCCPKSIISPLAFGILWIMKWMYGFWPHNYGIVIIILVFFVRLIMHPITKKSQVSMHKMQKVFSDPEVQEIKKKYAKKPLEMQRHISAFQKEKGISPASSITSFLPMLVQMPIWIALWSAIYASIDLRGAEFLPFWITDLSVPDALVRFSTITIPWIGWKIESLNLLPLMMGVAFFLQQKLMPKQAAAAANPQVAQQQKMMMFMMPLLFPLMLYNAPSGVNLYIMSSTFAGVIEQFVIRKHIREKEESESQGFVSVTKKTGGKVKKKKPKPFFKN